MAFVSLKYRCPDQAWRTVEPGNGIRCWPALGPNVALVGHMRR